MQVTIVTPVGVKFAGDAASITAPSVMGDVGILPGHRPLMAALRTGMATVSIPGQEPLNLVVDGGYVHVVSGEHVSIVTELCENWHEIDAGKAKSDHETATQALQASREDVASLGWKVKRHDVDLAETRLRVLATKP